jgi:hypothetical protein
MMRRECRLTETLCRSASGQMGTKEPYSGLSQNRMAEAGERGAYQLHPAAPHCGTYPERMPVQLRCVNGTYARTRTAAHIRNVCPCKNCGAYPERMPVQELRRIPGTYARTRTAAHTRNVCPRKNCGAYPERMPVQELRRVPGTYARARTAARTRNVCPHKNCGAYPERMPVQELRRIPGPYARTRTAMCTRNVCPHKNCGAYPERMPAQELRRVPGTYASTRTPVTNECTFPQSYSSNRGCEGPYSVPDRGLEVGARREVSCDRYRFPWFFSVPQIPLCTACLT